VHSWGSTMAFAATGHLPFGGGSYETIFYRIVSGRADLTGVPAPLVPLISAALARDPTHRPSASWLSAQATVLDMSAVVGSGPAPTATYAGSPFPPTGTPGKTQAPGETQPPGEARAPGDTRAPGEARGPGEARVPKAAFPPAAAGAPAVPYAAPQAPKQAARDVADLLPPVNYEPARSQKQQRQQKPQPSPAWPP